MATITKSNLLFTRVDGVCHDLRLGGWVGVSNESVSKVMVKFNPLLTDSSNFWRTGVVNIFIPSPLG